MKITDLKAVVLDPPLELQRYKYLTITVDCEHGGQKRFVRVLPHDGFNYHRHILRNFEDELTLVSGLLKIVDYGGGGLRTDLEARSIAIYGASQDYGKERGRDETARLLRSEFPDFEIIDWDAVYAAELREKTKG